MIIITGAARGIGRGLFDKFLKDGHEIVGTYNSTQPPDELAKYFRQVDLQDYRAVENLVEGLADRLDQVELIHCAGINYSAFAHKADVAAWTRVININLIGSFHIVRALLPRMREQGYGRIVLMSSVVANRGVAGTSAYAASKAGLAGLVTSIAKENGHNGVTINALNLGYMNAGMIEEVPPQLREKIIEQTPLRRLGEIAEIGRVIKVLLATEYLHGTSIDLDGGLW